jgi:hypothetical protein
MQCTGVWFAGGKFGLSWKAVQIRADKIPMRIRGPAFLPDDSVPGIVNTKSQFAALEEEEDDEYVNDEEALAPPPRPAMSKPQPSPPPVEDDDNESTSVDPVPVPKKPVKLVKKPPPKK